MELTNNKVLYFQYKVLTPTSEETYFSWRELIRDCSNWTDVATALYKIYKEIGEEYEDGVENLDFLFDYIEDALDQCGYRLIKDVI